MIRERCLTMGKRFFYLGLLLIVFITTGFARQGMAAETSQVRGNTVFALDLYKKLALSEKNIFFSPYSISVCLAMTSAGARGKTLGEMEEVLHLCKNPGKGFKDINHCLDACKCEMINANAIWAEKNHQLLDSFVRIVKEDYLSEVHRVNFKKDPEGQRTKINTWVEDRTHGHIKGLIPGGVIDTFTRMVLVNAIYFKGLWAHGFDPDQTSTLPFYPKPGEEISTEMMTITESFNYREDKELKVIELPYKRNNISMFILLPQKRHSIRDIEAKLNADTLEGLTHGLKKTRVCVCIPKFRSKNTFRLDKTLESLGMRIPFSTGADFSGMDGSRDLMISALLHQAFVEVNEEGTEAAAATAVIMTLTSMPDPPTTLCADHPFLFIIRHNPSKSILFMGRLQNPQG
ncbi:MAG: serpin family protein [Thermodesulfobacteriota bacterium]|nr:serpin family protein [Thermodesulfobacteriota bacterium]